MKVSVRLQQSLRALAIVLSLVVTQSLTTAIGQDSFIAGNQSAQATSEINSQFAAQPASSQTELAEARRLLLKARQALALSDVETAQSMLQAAKQQNVDFGQVGDSPLTVQSMIDRQTQLAELAARKDRSFNAGAASFLLTQAEALMYYQDFETAEMLVAQARKFPVQFNAAIGNPDQLEKMIQVARNNAGAAQATAASAQMQNVRPAVPSKKAEAMKLLSQAQLAMDQEKWNDAKNFVDQAKTLGVPESEFAANEARPWQYELKIQNVLNRQTSPQSNFGTQQLGVVPASYVLPQTGEKVIQADYDPANDTTFNSKVSGSEGDAESAAFNPIPKTAAEFYKAGLTALDAKNPEEARGYFERAWASRDQLDPTTVQSVQDQLTRLTMSKPAARTASGVRSASLDVDDPLTQQQAQFRKLQSEVFRERAAAERLLKSNPREAIEKMTMIRGRIAQSQLEAASQRPLLTIIDRDLDSMQAYIDQNLPEIINDETNAARKESVELTRQRRYDVETQIQKLVEDFNNLVDEQRFAEAQVVARQARDLDPKSEIVVLLTEKARFISRLARMNAIRSDKEQGIWSELAAAEAAGIPMDSAFPMQIGDADRFREMGALRAARADQLRGGTEADRRIWNILRNERVQGEYKGTLSEAVDQLSRQAGVNIVFDELALQTANVRKDQMVDMPIREAISLRSALDLILQSAGLVYVVENEVIKVTSADARQTKLNTETYYIGDLVMPIMTPQHPMQMHYSQPRVNGMGGGAMNVSANGGQMSQLAMAQQMGGQAPGNPFSGMGYNGNSFGGNNGPQMGQPTTGYVGGQAQGGITLQDFTPLIDLIQSTISPDSWQDTGQGLGTIEAFVPNLSLIVSQTQEIQDQIQDLLTKLRELNDVQIVVEVRFISLRDDYFERIGVDFDFSINDNSQTSNPLADTPSGGSTIVGNSGTDSDPFTPTSDLDLQFLQGSFTAAQPVFGGFQAATAANFGFAILSDIEVFFLVQASKGDQRTNITQAPTVTMFNGQSASITDGAQRPFVTSVIPVVGDFAVAHQPVITILPDGTNLNVTAVVSDNRKFVRLQLVPFFSQVTEVQQFTFDGSTTTESTSNSVLDDLLDVVDGGSNADDSDQEITTTTQGITVQLPVLSVTSVSTVVSVPDGGTVLMGGIKRMREGRIEEGVPFLSNVPYVNRLFKNVAIGHETSNLMMMVTPRIIIQSEIEEDQVGGSSQN